MAVVKRTLDILVSGTALGLLSPVLSVVALALWLQDRHTPFYVAERAAKGGGNFRMVKFRSMKIGADQSGVDSTGARDTRITPIGHVLRRSKLDELPQLWNVLTGDMSLVGPRPQVMREVGLYTDVERELLTVRPGVTDLSSIVFSDEGDILNDQADPDLAYNQLIRPWKSRLGLLYARNVSLRLDLEVIVLTAIALWSRPAALAGVGRVLARIGADEQTCHVSRRAAPLRPSAPPGAAGVILHR